MVLYFHALLLTLLAMLVAAHCTEAEVDEKLFTIPNPINDSRVIYLGKFAVDEHNKEASNTKLQFEGVAEAKQRNVVFENASGVQYDLTILATTIQDPWLSQKLSSVQSFLNGVRKYEVGVFDKQFGPNSFTKLLYEASVSEGPSPGPSSLAPRKQ